MIKRGPDGRFRKAESFPVGEKAKVKIDSKKTFVRTWDGQGKDGFVALIDKILSPLMPDGAGIQVSVPHSRAELPGVGADRFYIHIWSSPITKDKEITPPDRIYGVSNRMKDHAHSPSMIGGSYVFKDENGYPVAELTNHNNLYVFHDAVHYGSSEELEILEILLKRVSEYIKSQGGLRLAPNPDDANNCVNLFLATSEQNKREKISSAEKSYKEAKKNMDYYVECLAKIEAERRQYLPDNKTSAELLSDLDAINNHHMTVETYMSEECIKVTTNSVTIEYEKDTFDIGCFEITLYPTGRLTIKNLTRRVDNHQHPHVSSIDSVCFGNIKQEIYSWLNNQQYALVYNAIIEFLLCVNPLGWYRSITNWPRVAKIVPPKEEKPTIKVTPVVSDCAGDCRLCIGCDVKKELAA